MPRYDFRCDAHGVFEATAGRDCTTQPCPRCGADARRAPFSGVPYLSGQTVVRSIPEPAYQQEAQLKASRRSGWDVDRAVRTMRKSLREDKQGNKSVALT